VRRTDFIPLITLPLPLISSKDDTLRIIVPVTEGKVFRVGEVKIQGNSIFSEQQILAGLGLQKGEILNGKRLNDAVSEDLRKAYGGQGFVQYDAEFNPEFKDNPSNPNEGIVDLTITINEGRQFRLRRLEFTGNTFTRDQVLRREFLLNEGDIYNQNFVDISVLRLNQTGYFDPLDKDQDVEVRTDEEQGEVDAIVKVKEKGRQQISLNGGVSGIGGSFFGLEYSTNNLLGRGEILSFQFGFGDKQRNLQITFQEPYFRDRPISVGFSLFASSYKFFGEGTFLSQNQDLLFDAQNPNGTVTADKNNLFTQNTYGASVFATAPLSEFLPKRSFSRLSRIGLTYQFTSTSIEDPKINQLDPTQGVPVIFAQPNIITSRITPTFVYDGRQPSANGIDTLRGRQVTASFALAGLGGDVRTYQPTVSYSEFIPVRRKKSRNAEVFGFRLQAGTIGSFGITEKIRNANSLAFVGGIPLYERYFLGSESDLRGYDARSIGPIAPYNGFITSRNVTVASNVSGTPTAIPSINSDLAGQLAQLGTFTGAGGANSAQISRNFQFIGGDTQLLGNFEYRIPIFGPVSLAAFADVGSVFNLRKTGTQTINSTFLEDDRFVGAGTLTGLALRNNPGVESSFGNLLIRENHVLTREEFVRIFCRGNRFGCPTSLPEGLQGVFLRGEAQTNSLLEVDNAAFNKFGDFRSSVGLELRVQVPVVNVPFRLIYFYNPNGKFGLTDEVPGLRLPGKRSGFRFSVGRTF
jgi:outer membrane protein insertion porin family